MEKKHVQAELGASEYQLLLQAANREKLTLKEAVREAAIAWALSRQRDRDPLFRIVGIAEGSSRSGRDHDKIYDED